MMAMTPAEKQNRYRQRLKEKQKKAPDLSASFPASRYADYLRRDGDAQQALSFINETLDSVGLHFSVSLEEDVDPNWREEWGTQHRGALGRAERLVDSLIDSAKALAEVINNFKVRETATALAKLESRSASSPVAARKMRADAVRLNSIRNRLGKQQRHSFFPTTVKGE